MVKDPIKIAADKCYDAMISMSNGDLESIIREELKTFLQDIKDDVEEIADRSMWADLNGELVWTGDNLNEIGPQIPYEHLDKAVDKLNILLNTNKNMYSRKRKVRSL